MRISQFATEHCFEVGLVHHLSLKSAPKITSAYSGVIMTVTERKYHRRLTQQECEYAFGRS